jgi:SET and MYND domain-containing protein
MSLAYNRFATPGCTPNVTKSRSSRALHFTTTKAINTGEELCISYIDVGTDLDNDLDPCADVANYTEDREERGKKLWEQWFFVCACQRCLREQLRATHA